MFPWTRYQGNMLLFAGCVYDTFGWCLTSVSGFCSKHNKIIGSFLITPFWPLYIKNLQELGRFFPHFMVVFWDIPLLEPWWLTNVCRKAWTGLASLLSHANSWGHCNIFWVPCVDSQAGNHQNQFQRHFCVHTRMSYFGTAFLDGVSFLTFYSSWIASFETALH